MFPNFVTVLMTPASANTGVGLHFAFYEHGTYTGVNTGTEVVLQNLNMWVDDLDSIATTDFQFAAFSGFQSYNLNKRAAGACTGGNTSIIYNVSTNPRCDDANLNVNPVPGTNQIRFTSTHSANGSNIPQDRASVLYASVSSGILYPWYEAVQGGTYWYIPVHPLLDTRRYEKCQNCTYQYIPVRTNL